MANDTINKIPDGSPAHRELHPAPTPEKPSHSDVATALSIGRSFADLLRKISLEKNKADEEAAKRAAETEARLKERMACGLDAVSSSVLASLVHRPKEEPAAVPEMTPEEKKIDVIKIKQAAGAYEAIMRPRHD